MVDPSSSSRAAAVRDRSDRRGIHAFAAAVALAGLLTVVAGTFLPWLTSGGVRRNSYAVLGIVRRLRFLDGGLTGTAMSWWPLIGAIAMLPVVAGILRWWRTAALATWLFGLLTGGGAVLVLTVAGGHQAAGISLTPTGPAVTTAGAALAVVGAALVLIAGRRSRRVPDSSIPANGDVSEKPPDRSYRLIAQGAAGCGPPWREPTAPPHTAQSATAVATERETAG